MFIIKKREGEKTIVFSRLKRRGGAFPQQCASISLSIVSYKVLIYPQKYINTFAKKRKHDDIFQTKQGDAPCITDYRLQFFILIRQRLENSTRNKLLYYIIKFFMSYAEGSM